MKLDASQVRTIPNYIKPLSRETWVICNGMVKYRSKSNCSSSRIVDDRVVLNSEMQANPITKNELVGWNWWVLQCFKVFTVLSDSLYIIRSSDLSFLLLFTKVTAENCSCIYAQEQEGIESQWRQLQTKYEGWRHLLKVITVSTREQQLGWVS